MFPVGLELCQTDPAQLLRTRQIWTWMICSRQFMIYLICPTYENILRTLLWKGLHLYTVSNVPAYDKNAAAMRESPTRRSIMASYVPIEACHRTNSPAKPLTSLSARSSLSCRVTRQGRELVGLGGSLFIVGWRRYWQLVVCSWLGLINHMMITIGRWRDMPTTCYSWLGSTARYYSWVMRYAN